MSFSRVPEDFMKGIFLAPYNFNDPENPQHAEYVHLQLRNDLYYSTLQEISNIEFSSFNLLDKEEWVKVEKMKECKQDLPWFSSYSNIFKKKRGRTLNESKDMKVDLLSCQDWEITYHKGQKKRSSQYRVHVLQSTSDIFKSQIFPPTLLKTLKDFLVN